MTRFDKLDWNKLSRSINKKELQSFEELIPEIKRELIHRHRWDSKLREMEKKFGVDVNTIRAFSNFLEPLQTYHNWAKKHTKKLTLDKLLHITASENNFKKWHCQLAKSIVNDAGWILKEKDKKELKFAYQYKLVDLYIKWLTRYDFGSKEINDGFTKYAHCALDSKILKKLKSCFNGSLSFIKNNPSMGDICDLDDYLDIQNAIKFLCSHTGKKASPILFDYYAWNYAE